MSATKPSNTAAHLKAAIAASGKSHAEIAAAIGMHYPNVVAMWANGLTKIPVEQLPQLARALDADLHAFIEIAMGEYHPQLWAMLMETGHLAYEPHEHTLLAVCRRVTDGRAMPWSDELEYALFGVFELAMADVPD